MQPVLVKAYGYFKPARQTHLEELGAALNGYGREVLDSLSLNGRLLQISYEGTFFPAQETSEALARFAVKAGKEAEARLDILDLESWTLHRYELAGEGLKLSSRPLNHVLEYSGL